MFYINKAIGFVVFIVVGCGSPGSNKQNTVSELSVTVENKSSSGLGNAGGDVQAKARVVGPVKINPPLPELTIGMQLHAIDRGWTSDSSEFGYCVDTDGDEDNICVFLQKPFSKKQSKTNIKKQYIKSQGQWIFSSDISITWNTKKSNIEIGGKISGESFVVDSAVKMPARNFGGIDVYDFHLDSILISPDGEYVGIISHSVGGHDFDELDIDVVSVSYLAGYLYNSTGLVYHKNKEFKKSKDLFEQAISINPSAAIYYYNLACSKSLLGDSGVEESLTKAVALDNLSVSSEKSIKSRAKKDSDFNSVRSEAWFARLIGN
jgi:hypothetical protein